MDVGAPELLVVLVVALLIFGPSQLPKLSRSIGEAVREFRHPSDESSDHDAPTGTSDSDPTPPAA